MHKQLLSVCSAEVVTVASGQYFNSLCQTCFMNAVFVMFGGSRGLCISYGYHNVQSLKAPINQWVFQERDLAR